MTNNFKSHLISLLKTDERLVDKDGDIRGIKTKELANQLDPALIELLLIDDRCKEKFFLQIKDSFVFRDKDFKFYLDANSIDNSFTQYENRIGLATGGEFLKNNTDVVLNWPYKDCVLEGGQSTEEGMDTYFSFESDTEDYIEAQSKRKEVFFNEVLAKDEIDRLYEPKAFENITKYTEEGKIDFNSFNRNEDGVITDNLLIKGNNLLSLKSIEKEFKNQVKLIYIDPPYNTENDSFMYNDNFTHSTWLTFMKNRLEAAYKFLKDDGFICCHIDDHEGQYLKVLMDEIFGRENFQTIFNIRVRYSDKTLKQDMSYHKEVEHVHIYGKSKKAFPNLNVRDTSIEKYIHYIKEVSPGKETILGGKKVVVFSKEQFEITKGTPSDDGRKEIWATGSILDGNSSGRFFRDFLEGRYNNDGLGVLYKVYGVGDERDGFRYFTGPQKKGATKGKYFQGIPTSKANDKTETYPINNYYDMASYFGNCRHEGGVEFRSGKKPEALLEVIIRHFSNEGDIVMDFHSGSGTTAACSLKLNRQFIAMEQIENQVALSSERLTNVIKGDKTGISKISKWNGGGTFINLTLVKNNESAKDHILACKNLKALNKLFDELYTKYFLHYNVRIQEFKSTIVKEDAFKDLSLDRQKEIFCRMLDLNQLYVNASEMEDKRYNLDKKDIQLTKDFYQLK